MEIIIFFIVCAVITIFFYLIPSFIAFSRKHDSKGWVLILNIFLGWTLLGWFFVLFWATFGQKDVVEKQSSIQKENKELYIVHMLLWLIMIVIAFITTILFCQILQPAFRQEVCIRVLDAETRSFPMYLYLFGYFICGLSLGVIATFLALLRKVK